MTKMLQQSDFCMRRADRNAAKKKKIVPSFGYVLLKQGGSDPQTQPDRRPCRYQYRRPPI